MWPIRFVFNLLDKEQKKVMGRGAGSLTPVLQDLEC